MRAVFAQLMAHSTVRMFVLFWWTWILFAGAARGDPADTACSLLSAAFPDRVYFFLTVSLNYARDNAHWAGSSEQASKCAVEPETASEVATIFSVINQTRTPWAVKGGGHAYNQGYSSTNGVLIALTRLNQTTYDAATSTATIGAGLVWDDVYANLCPQGVNVVGARVPGVGVAGFALGGGYSWSSQQYGLTIDTAVSYELVTPTGAILNVTNTSHPDLFFGLRGGGNNFGIVTAFTLKTHPQTDVYGGALIFIGNTSESAVTQAIVNFDANNTDPKAAILASYTAVGPTLEAVVFLFYDGPTLPNGTFDEFLNISALINTVEMRTFPDFIQALGIIPDPIRATAQTVPIIQYTSNIVNEIVNQTKTLGSQLLPELGLFATLSIESFMRDTYNHSVGGAYPHNSTHPWTPFQILVSHVTSLDDDTIRQRVLNSSAVIQEVAIAEGQSSTDAILYNNYAMAGTPLSLLYGANLGTLQALRAKYDPDNLLNLTGGWKL